MSAREERLVTENNLWQLDTWLDEAGVFAKPHYDYVNNMLVNTGIKFGNNPTRMTAFIGDTIVRHEDGTHTVLSAKDAAELARLRAERHSTNEALSDAAEQLRVQRDRIAEVTAQRDAWHDWADSLAYKVAPVEVLGRHGDEGRFPWDDALKLITPAAEVAALRARIAELEAERKKYVGVEPTIAEEMAYLGRCLDAVRDVCDAAEKQATRWENPLPVPEWVAMIRNATDGVTVNAPTLPPVPQQRQAEDPHTSDLHHDYAIGRDLPFIPQQVTGRCPEGHTFEDCTCGGAA